MEHLDLAHSSFEKHYQSDCDSTSCAQPSSGYPTDFQLDSGLDHSKTLIFFW